MTNCPKKMEYHEMAMEKIMFQHDVGTEHQTKSAQEWIANWPFMVPSWSL